MKYTYVAIICLIIQIGFGQKMDSCDVFVIINKKHNDICYIKNKGGHSMLKLNNGKRYPTAEWLNFSGNKLHITKGFNGVNQPYVGDTIINFEDIKWVFWDGIPRKKLRSRKYYFRIEKKYTNCEYRGWNHLYFKNEMAL